MLHDRNELDFDPIARRFSVVVAGHSHRPSIQRESGVLYLNPGSAGPRRFSLPVGVAHLAIRKTVVRATLKTLEVGIEKAK